MTLAALRAARHGTNVRARSEREKRVLTPAQARVVSLSQWLTEPWLADVVAEIAGVHGKRVLEPSCGDGELVRACLDVDAKSVTAVELDAKMANRAARRFAGNRAVSVIASDFLTLGSARLFDVAVMNSPYESGADAAHLEHALTLAPRAVAIMRLNALAGATRYERLWSRFDTRQVFVLPQRPDFGREARRVGMVSTGAESDFVVVDVLARAPRAGSRPSMEWIRRLA